MVGFNRRFAPHVVQLRAALAGVPGPRAFVYVVNAGALPGGHWTQDRAIGGGRIVGEACHMIDLLRSLAGAPISGWHAVRAATDDVAIVTLQFADGSIGAVHYLANGHRRFPKERLEVFAGGSVYQLDNFARLTAFGRPLPAGRWPWVRGRGQDKGHTASVAAFLESVRGGPPPIPPDEIFEVSGIAIQIADALAAAPAGRATLG
ncbi:MAG: Gfo/Idh/MocA family oxidoreductase, partial [Gemmatimonadota bacterium]